MMKQITLNEYNFNTLVACVGFSLDDVRTTEGQIAPGIGEYEIVNLESAIEFCTKDVSV